MPNDTRTSRLSSGLGVFRRRFWNTTKTTTYDPRPRTNRLIRNVTTTYTRSRSLQEVHRPQESDSHVSSLTRNVFVAEMALCYRLLKICRRQERVSRAVRLTKNDTLHDMDSTLFLVQKSLGHLAMRVTSHYPTVSIGQTAGTHPPLH